VWREAEPITTHMFVVLILVFSLAIVGSVIIGLGKLIDKLVTNHLGEYTSYIERIDFWLIVACLVLFGLYTLVIIAIRLYHEVAHEFRKEPGKIRNMPRQRGGE
jgi:H+/Cl- antiporter ClcA